MTKKIILITGILVIIGAAIFLVFNSKNQDLNEGGGAGFSFTDYIPFFGDKDTEIPNNENGEDLGLENDNENLYPDNSNENEIIPRIRKISNEPVAGSVIFDVGSSSIVRFIEKGTGNVYEARSDTTKVTRLTNTTIPKIVRAFWLPDGSGFLAQTLQPENELIETSFVKLEKNIEISTSTEDLTPFNTTISKLPTGIREIAIKSDGSKIFYYVKKGSGSEWFISNPDGTKNESLLVNPLSEWLPIKWVGDTLYLQTKTSSNLNSSVYNFNFSNKTLKKGAIEALGLSVNFKDDGSFVLFSSKSSVYTNDTKTSSTTKLNIATLADKCVWSKSKIPDVYCAEPEDLPKGNYPDVWYKGLILTKDVIKKYNAASDMYYEVLNLSTETREQIDVSDISISSKETNISFRNKIDGYLWMLRVE